MTEQEIWTTSNMYGKGIVVDVSEISSLKKNYEQFIFRKRKIILDINIKYDR